MAEAIAGACLDSDGTFTRRCAEHFQQAFQIRHVLMVPSCTAALEMAAILCDIQPGDEVIMPSFTFVSTANAIVLRGGVEEMGIYPIGNRFELRGFENAAALDGAAQVM